MSNYFPGMTVSVRLACRVALVLAAASLSGCMYATGAVMDRIAFEELEEGSRLPVQEVRKAAGFVGDLVICVAIDAPGNTGGVEERQIGFDTVHFKEAGLHTEGRSFPLLPVEETPEGCAGGETISVIEIGPPPTTDYTIALTMRADDEEPAVYAVVDETGQRRIFYKYLAPEHREYGVLELYPLNRKKHGTPAWSLALVPAFIFDLVTIPVKVAIYVVLVFVPGG